MVMALINGTTNNDTLPIEEINSWLAPSIEKPARK